jgi:hypothetical protein
MMKNFDHINRFLLANDLLPLNNPAVSPDMTLDFEKLLGLIRQEKDTLGPVTDLASAEIAASKLHRLVLWHKSIFQIGNAAFFVIESKSTGDCALITSSRKVPEFEDTASVGPMIHVVPLSWSNLIRLKNLVFETDPSNTIFPRADTRLKKTSLGIGARFTTLHWPAVAWAMKALDLPVTANQNSIPRELVYDVQAMLENRLAKVPFPFIGTSVPEGHQGQSVQGMSHASIITLLKHGFHRQKIPWGFNADHQPIGGRFDAIEKELVEGSLFASYITYDMSPELSLNKPLEDPEALETAFRGNVEPAVFNAVVKRVALVPLDIPIVEIKKLVTYLMPAMKKVKQRDGLYVGIRKKMFPSEPSRELIKELSIDELPGETTPRTLAVCLALVESMGMRFDFVAPNIGFQKNIPYADNAALEKKIVALFAVAKSFGVSIGFHSGSGKSADNYRTMGRTTQGRFEVKTSGRYTYEMGVALSKSTDPEDRKLWVDWYAFTKELALKGAFSEDAAQRSFAREFIMSSLKLEGASSDTVFESPKRLKQTLDNIKPSPDHAFWFEYNFLFILAGKGSIDRLGDHSPQGYAQRGRFYRISDQAKLLFAQRVAGYILFLAETTGIRSEKIVEEARIKLASFKSYEALLDDIG